MQSHYLNIGNLRITYFPSTGETYRHSGLGRPSRPLKLNYLKDDFNSGERSRVSLNGKRYIKTHIIWLIMHGRLPYSGMVIDHIDGDHLNNRFDNLREIPQHANQLNRKCHRQGNSPGVSFQKAVRGTKGGKRWKVEIQKDGERVFANVYSTQKEAVEAHRAAYIDIYNFDPLTLDGQVFDPTQQ